MLSVPSRPSTRTEILIGRSLAVCVHPVAAWRSGSMALRLQFFAGYFVASYVIIFLGLLLLGHAPTS
jgi:hypothetical protein